MATPELTPAPLPPPSFAGYTGQPGMLVGVTFGTRLGARVIDLVAHYLIAGISGLIFGVLLGIAAVAQHVPVQELTHRVGQTSITGFVLALLGSVAYHSFSEGVGGASIGKQMLGLVVVKTDTAPCDVKAGVIRSLAYLIDSLFFGLVAYLQMNKTPQQQRYGDHWAGTLVVKRAALAAGTPAATRSPWGGIALGCAADSALLIFSFVIKLL